MRQMNVSSSSYGHLRSLCLSMIFFVIIEHWECAGTTCFEEYCTTHQSMCQMGVWSSSYDHLRCSFARSLDRSIARSFDRSIARSPGRSLARSLARAVARSLDRSIPRSLDRSIAPCVHKTFLVITRHVQSGPVVFFFGPHS